MLTVTYKSMNTQFLSMSQTSIIHSQSKLLTFHYILAYYKNIWINSATIYWALKWATQCARFLNEVKHSPCPQKIFHNPIMTIW